MHGKDLNATAALVDAVAKTDADGRGVPLRRASTEPDARTTTGAAGDEA